MASGFDVDAMIEQEWNFVTQVVAALSIRDGNLGAVFFQEERRGHARFAEADDQHAFAVQFHSKVISPRRHRDTEKSILFVFLSL